MRIRESVATVRCVRPAPTFEGGKILEAEVPGRTSGCRAKAGSPSCEAEVTLVCRYDALAGSVDAERLCSGGELR